MQSYHQYLLVPMAYEYLSCRICQNNYVLDFLMPFTFRKAYDVHFGIIICPRPNFCGHLPPYLVTIDQVVEVVMTHSTVHQEVAQL